MLIRSPTNDHCCAYLVIGEDCLCVRYARHHSQHFSEVGFDCELALWGHAGQCWQRRLSHLLTLVRVGGEGKGGTTNQAVGTTDSNLKRVEKLA